MYMKYFILGLLGCIGLGGCATPPPPAVRPGAVLKDRDLPPVDGGDMMPSDVAPVPIKMRNPVYPYELRKKNIEGEVVVEFVIDRDGKVVEAHAVQSPDPRLSTLAVDAIMQAEFRPAMRAGKPTTARMRLPITFELAKAKPPESIASRGSAELAKAGTAAPEVQESLSIVQKTFAALPPGQPDDPITFVVDVSVAVKVVAHEEVSVRLVFAADDSNDFKTLKGFTQGKGSREIHFNELIKHTRARKLRVAVMMFSLPKETQTLLAVEGFTINTEELRRGS